MKAILFDLFGTLIPNLPPVEYDAVMGDLAKLFDTELDPFKVEWQKGFVDRMSGAVQDGDEQFIPILETLGLPYTKKLLSEATQIRRTYMRRSLTPKGGAVELLQELQRRSYRLALVTDCSSDTPHLLDETPLGEFFEARAVSAFLGVRKPDPKMYRHVLDLLGVEGQDCLYVGDGNSQELPGANRQGMRTVWVDNGALQHWHERFVPEADHSIQDLREVLTILEAASD